MKATEANGVDAPPVAPVSYGQLPIEDIAPDPQQPRKEFNKDKLEEMRDSIKSQGITQPLCVRPRRHVKEAPVPYVLITGERRWRAAKLAGLKMVPVIIRQNLDEHQVFALQMTENLQRENLTALEEAKALRRRVDAGKKPEELAAELGLSRATVFNRLRLAELDDHTRKALEAGRISATVASLAVLVPEDQREEFVDEVAATEWNGPMPYRKAQEEVENYVRQLRDAGFDPKVDYVAKCRISTNGGISKNIVSPTCEPCPRRSGNMPDSGLKSLNVCTVPKCYEVKTALARDLAIAEATAKGQTVLAAKAAEEALQSKAYVDLGERCEELGFESKSPWRTAIKDKLAELKPVVAVDAQGKAHELVKATEARAALEETAEWKKAKKRGEAGVARVDRYQDEQRAVRARKRIETAVDDAIGAALVAKAEQLKITEHKLLWSVLTGAFVDLGGFYLMEPVRRRRGLDKGTWNNDPIQKFLKGATPGQQIGLLVELAARRTDADCKMLAKELGVNVEKVTQVTKEELKAKKKTKAVKPKKKNKKGKKGAAK